MGTYFEDLAHDGLADLKPAGRPGKELAIKIKCFHCRLPEFSLLGSQPFFLGSGTMC